MGIITFLFENPKSYAEKPLKKVWKENTKDLMKQVLEVLKSTNFDDNLQSVLKTWISEQNISFGKYATFTIEFGGRFGRS